MTQTLISGLISDDGEAVAAFGESDTCVVVDWRDGADEILEAVAAFLPRDCFCIERRGCTEWEVRAGERPAHTVQFPQGTKQEEFFVALNQVLAPDFELWQYTPVNGDGYSLFLAPSAWWRSFAAEHPKVLAKYFLSADRLAAYMRRSYFVRLFSKP